MTTPICYRVTDRSEKHKNSLTSPPPQEKESGVSALQLGQPALPKPKLDDHTILSQGDTWLTKAQKKQPAGLGDWLPGSIIQWMGLEQPWNHPGS